MTRTPDTRLPARTGGSGQDRAGRTPQAARSTVPAGASAVQTRVSGATVRASRDPTGTVPMNTVLTSVAVSTAMSGTGLTSTAPGSTAPASTALNTTPLASAGPGPMDLSSIIPASTDLTSTAVSSTGRASTDRTSTDLSSTTPASTGLATIWVNNKVVYQREKPGVIGPYPDRFEASLEKGRNQVLVRLTAPKDTAEFQVRFRHKRATAGSSCGSDRARIHSDSRAI